MKKLIQLIKKYLPDIFIIIGVGIASYNLLKPLKINIVSSSLNSGTITMNYHIEREISIIILIAIAIDIFIRRYLIKKLYMSKKIISILFVILLLVILIAGYFIIFQKTKRVEQGNNISLCNKENNCCVEDSDCQYIWYTGGCNTPEYVAKTQKEAQKQGILLGEAPSRENVTCTCENHKCITHN